MSALPQRSLTEEDTHAIGIAVLCAAFGAAATALVNWGFEEAKARLERSRRAREPKA